MPTRKAAKKTTKKATGKKAAKSRGLTIPKLTIPKITIPKIPIPGTGPHPLYGMPIDRAIASGNLAEMRRHAAAGKKYLSELKRALAGLERKIGGSKVG